MTDKEITNEEIISSLTYCNADRNDCDKCVLNRKCESYPFHSAVAEYALDLITRQQSEIERLRATIDSFTDIGKLYSEIRAEAYKEFAKEVNKEITKAYNNNSEVLREHLRKHGENPDFEFIAAIQGKMNALRGLDDFIDNLLKEMAGEEE